MKQWVMSSRCSDIVKVVTGRKIKGYAYLYRKEKGDTVRKIIEWRATTSIRVSK